MDETEIFDYGFSTHSEEELKSREKKLLSEKDEKITEAKRRIMTIKTIIFPFLEHLKSDPLKPYLEWKNRAEKVTELMTKLEPFFEEVK